MKKIIAVLMVLCLVAGAAVAQEEQPGYKVTMDKMAANMGRGVVNMLTGWLEVPRGLWYEGTRNPYYGTVVGLINGSFLAVARGVGGAADFLSFGLTGPGIYGESFPEYVWEAQWNPEDRMIDQ
jgi:putative exosortase-associated protein (TIGR04073 family)